MNAHPPAVAASDLTFGYGSTLVLSHVNFEIQEGETIGIIGPNGGGKTTLLKLIMGFLTPNKGEIRIFGQSQKQARELLAYVPQRLPFDKDFPDLCSGGGVSREIEWHGLVWGLEARRQRGRPSGLAPGGIE